MLVGRPRRRLAGAVVTGRAALLAGLADEFMASGRTPELPARCLGFRASLYPPGEPREVHFAVTWPDITLVCVRSLDGYSLSGGLHRADRDAS